MILAVMIVTAAFTLYSDFQSRPGFIQKVWAEDRGTDTVSLSWTEARNAESYTITYRDRNEKKVLTVKDNCAEIDGLSEGEAYRFTIRADSEERKGHEDINISTSTRKPQKIKGEEHQMKLCDHETDLGLTSKTPITIEGEGVDKGETVAFTVPGEVELTATAEETEEYAADSMSVKVDVIDSVNEDPAGAGVHVLYSLDKSNCELVRSVEGVKAATVPQSIAYDGDVFYIAYGMDDAQRIIRFSDAGKDVSVPKIKLGHPNGLACADGKCYSVRGWTGKCVIYDPENETYNAMNLSYGASGIAYDRDRELFYTSSRSRMVAYDKNFTVVNSTGTVAHKNYYTQDCGGCAGIMMHCMSDKTKHGINYVDLYDMVNGKYLGSVKCDLDEVESADVDEDGYMVLLSNTKDDKDNIWKTPINIRELGADL